MFAIPYSTLNLGGKWYNADDPTVTHSHDTTQMILPSPTEIQFDSKQLSQKCTMYQWNVENDSETEDLNLLEGDAVSQSPTFRRIKLPLYWQLGPNIKTASTPPPAQRHIPEFLSLLQHCWAVHRCPRLKVRR
jgi:hypothetical protein